MEQQDNFQMNPFPIEKEFRVLSVRERLHELTREDLEEFLTEALSIMTKLAHQVTQFKEYVDTIEGKTK
jgi:hypothetical protein